MKISIFGMGYVGSVTAACLARSGHEIVGVDLSRRKVEEINAGAPPVFEKGLPELFKKYVAERKIIATCDQKEAILKTEASLVCVGTPSLESVRIDHSHVRRLC
jgi:UDP-glucose 6-dehydrogenase